MKLIGEEEIVQTITPDGNKLLVGLSKTKLAFLGVDND
jgi:hypothetical protein